MTVRAFIVVLAIGLLAAGSSFGADVDVSASVDKTEVYDNETVKLTIEIQGAASDVPDISLPQLDGFQSFSSGTTQNFTLVNGRAQVSKSFSFSLIPTRTGVLKIPAMTLEVDGETYQTKEFTITVNSGSRHGTQSDRRQSDGRSSSGTRSPGIGADDLFITTSVNKDTVYVNEQVTLSLEFYRAQEVDVLREQEFKAPQKTGFWVEDLPPQNSSYKTLNGRRYQVIEIKTALFPTTSGEPTIGAAELTVLVREPMTRDPFSFFDRDFFGFSGRSRAVALKSDPIQIVSLPLPSEGRPADFSGAVGRYSISAQVDKQTVEANEPITLKLRISGTGNIRSVATPKVPELPDFRSYQSGDSENLTKANYQVGGSKTFEYVFIPKRAGTYLLPAVSYSFFDPAVAEYKTMSTQPIQVEVTPAKDRYVSQMQNLEANQIDLVAKDIRYLKSDLGSVNGAKSGPLALSPWFVLLYLVPVIGYLVVSGQKRRQDRLQTDRSYRRLKQAKKMAAKRLSQAEEHLRSNDPDSFYSEINRSVIDYFADRFDLPSFGLTADSIKEYARDKLGDATTRRILDLLQQCDFGRFAPGGTDSDQMRRLWQQAKDLIVELEKTR